MGVKGLGYTPRRSLLKHCAGSQKFASCIPDGPILIFKWLNFSDRLVALRSTQPLTQISTRVIFWGVKQAGACGWQPCQLHVQVLPKFFESQPPGELRDSRRPPKLCFT